MALFPDPVDQHGHPAGRPVVPASFARLRIGSRLTGKRPGLGLSLVQPDRTSRGAGEPSTNVSRIHKTCPWPARLLVKARLRLHHFNRLMIRSIKNPGAPGISVTRKETGDDLVLLQNRPKKFPPLRKQREMVNVNHISNFRHNHPAQNSLTTFHITGKPVSINDTGSRSS